MIKKKWKIGTTNQIETAEIKFVSVQCCHRRCWHEHCHGSAFSDRFRIYLNPDPILIVMVSLLLFRIFVVILLFSLRLLWNFLKFSFYLLNSFLIGQIRPLLSFIFGLFKQISQFLQQYTHVKNVHPISVVGIETRNLLDVKRHP